jgi:hypothetical protein
MEGGRTSPGTRLQDQLRERFFSKPQVARKRALHGPLGTALASMDRGDQFQGQWVSPQHQSSATPHHHPVDRKPP